MVDAVVVLVDLVLDLVQMPVLEVKDLAVVLVMQQIVKELVEVEVWEVQEVMVDPHEAQVVVVLEAMQ
jgi:hypothetical protein